MFRKLREAQNEEGFTLIELLVVVLIIGILAAIAIPVFLDQRQKAYRDAVESDLRNMALVMEDFASDYTNYPTTVTQAGGAGGDITLSDGTNSAVFNASEGVILNAYVVDTTGTDAGYCFEGWHTAFPGGAEDWMYSARGVTTAEVVHDPAGGQACVAATP